MQTIAFISLDQVAGAELYYDFVNYFTAQGSKEDQEHAPTSLFSIPIRSSEEFKNALLLNWSMGADIFVFPRKLTQEEKKIWEEFVKTRPLETSPEKLSFYDFSTFSPYQKEQSENEKLEYFHDIYTKCKESLPKKFSFNNNYLRVKIDDIIYKGKDYYSEVYNYIYQDLKSKWGERLENLKKDLLQKQKKLENDQANNESPKELFIKLNNIETINSAIKETEENLKDIETEVSKKLKEIKSVIESTAETNSARNLKKREYSKILKYLSSISTELSKIIGVIGGAGPLASATYYRLLAEKHVFFIGLDDTLAPYKSKCIMEGRHIADSEDFRIHYLNCILMLNGLINFLTLPCNTAHIFTDCYKLFLKENIEILDIRDAVISGLEAKFLKRSQDRSQNNNLHKEVFILGTPATVQKDLYNDKLISAKYTKIIKPDKILLDKIYDIIFMVKKDTDLAIAREDFYQIITEIEREHPKADILFVCTELSVFYIENDQRIKLQGRNIASSTHALSTYASIKANAEKTPVNHEDVVIEHEPTKPWPLLRSKARSIGQESSVVGFHTPQPVKKPPAKSLSCEEINISGSNYETDYLIESSISNASSNSTEASSSSLGEFTINHAKKESSDDNQENIKKNIFQDIVKEFNIIANMPSEQKIIILIEKHKNTTSSMNNKSSNSLLKFFNFNKFNTVGKDIIDIKNYLDKIKEYYTDFGATILISTNKSNIEICATKDIISKVQSDLKIAGIETGNHQTVNMHR
ncbi:MAG: aspartate/glutamate racemase family protein [Alphaproteobacteria bacterium]